MRWGLVVALFCAGCAPEILSNSSAPNDARIPNNDQFVSAMTAPVEVATDDQLLIHLNCREYWRLQCKPLGNMRADCAYAVSRTTWNHAVVGRSPDGTWRWLSGDRVCPWTGTGRKPG